MMYIEQFAGISYQPPFDVEAPLHRMKPIDNSAAVHEADYQKYIDAQVRRRMSDQIKRGVTCAMRAVEGIDINALHAIFVATGLGCLKDTQQFLQVSLQSKPPSPTAFIQSTHNSIAGQIAIQLQCKGANMTYSQGERSFERAIMDTYLEELQEHQRVLVGAIDERIPFLDQAIIRINPIDQDSIVGAGAFFFLLAPIRTAQSKASLVDCILTSSNQVSECIQIVHRDTPIDLLLYGNYCEAQAQINQNLKHIPSLDFTLYSGQFMVQSAFALDLALKFLEEENIQELQQLCPTIKRLPRRIFILNDTPMGMSGLIVDRI